MTGRRYIDPHEISSQICAPLIDRNQCTAIVPAAGRGSRLGADVPKILFPVHGLTTLERLVDVLSPFCCRFVFVVSPQGRTVISAAAERVCAGMYTITEQAEATGMFDAVNCGLPYVATPHALVIWGDQVTVRSDSLRACFELHYGPLAPAATVPTLLCDEPYIHFERDGRGAIVRVLQAREKDAMPSRGESDCGVFLFRTTALREAMEKAHISGGTRSGERNFLPVLPWMDGQSSVLCVRIATPIEAVGINTRADAERIAMHFRALQAEVKA